MFALTTIVKKSNGTHDYYSGSLCPLPVELTDIVRRRAYLAVSSAGWTKSDFGYLVFAIRGSNSDLFIFPGLWPSDGDRPLKRYPDYKPTFTRAQIESFARGVVDFFEQTAASIYSDLNMLIHDLRALSSNIYNSAVEAERNINFGFRTEALKRIENVKACQAMLRMRTDALDFLGNPASIIDDSEIAVFRKVDKVIRIFRSHPGSSEESKRIELRGPSIGYVRGPEVLELVPYALIDNALKYAPRNTTCDVTVKDGDMIIIEVSSLGPKIDDSELVEIFVRGRRGKFAILSGVGGSGVGLFLVEKLVAEYFGGRVLVEQGKSAVNIDGIEYFPTTFTVELPAS